MGHDSLSSIAPVQVNVGLVPAGKIQQSRYDAFIARLRRENVVRLGDVSPDKRSGKNLFSPLAFPSGQVILDLSTSDNGPPTIQAFPFELNRNSQIVLGIADGRAIQKSIEDGKTEEDANIAFGKIVHDLGDELYSSLPAREGHILHRLLIFDINKPSQQEPHNQYVEYVPSPEDSRTTTIKTIMCDIVALLLASMEDMAADLQELTAVDPPQAQAKEQSRQENLADKVRQRMSTPTLPTQKPTSPGLNLNRESSPRVQSPETRSRVDVGRSPSAVRDSSGASQSRERMSVQVANTASPSERRKTQAKGRIRVSLGAMYLQAGRWPDALRELTEAALVLRMNSDYLWHAKCLDYTLVCMVMLGWAGIEFQIPASCFPVSEKTQLNKPSQSTPTASRTDISNQGLASAEKKTVALQSLARLVPDLIGYIFNLYSRASSFTQDILPALLMYESVIRFAKLLNALRIRHGEFDQVALQYLVKGSVLEPRREGPPAPINLKSEISSMLFKAIPTTADDLFPSDAVRILAGLASVLSAIGMQRRMAFVLSRLLTVATPGLVEARKVGAAEFGIHPAAGLSALLTAQHDLSNLSFSAENVRLGLRNLLDIIVSLYGVVPKNALQDAAHGSQISADTTDALRNEKQTTVVHSIEQAGDVSLKIEILGGCLDICEALPDFHGVLDFSVQLLRVGQRTLFMPEPYESGSPWISQDEQIRLSNNIKRTVAAASKLGIPNVEAEYWDYFLIRGIELLDLSTSGKLIPHSSNDLAAVNTSTEASQKDPFIFNPFAKTAQENPADRVVVAGEMISLQFTLQNPFDIDVEIDCIRASADGCDFEAYPQSLYIEPYCLQSISLSGLPRLAGKLQIKGCYVKVKGCRERFFPIVSKKMDAEKDHKMKLYGPAARHLDLSRSTLPDEDSKSPKKAVKDAPAEKLSVTVLEPQPSLKVRSASLPQSAIMVLEGETKMFEITLLNDSEVSVDLCLVTFQDSATKQIQDAMNDRGVSPSELYEYQVQLKPSLQLVSKQIGNLELSIAPRQSIKLEVAVFGRPGLLTGSVQIDYAHLGVPKTEVKGQFYTRKLLYPVTVTVNAGVEITRCNLLPFNGDLAWANQRGRNEKTFELSPASNSASPISRPSMHTRISSKKLGNSFTSLLSRLGLGAYGDNHCLMLIDLRNIWPAPLSISIQVRESLPSSSSMEDDWKHAYTVQESLQPGHISRVVLIVPRILISDPYKPIPLLANQRQYVVSASKSSAESELASREIFWFREELLKHIRGTWKEETSGRHGDIDLRKGIRLTSRMADSLRIEEIEISYTMKSSDAKFGGSIEQFNRSGFRVPTNAFVSLCTCIHNNSSEPLHVLLRLQPSIRHQPYTVALDLSKRFAWTGLLQQALHPLIQPGETREVELSVIALCAGEYEIGATVEQIRRPARNDSRASVDGQIVGQINERRLWQARESCIIHAEETA
ncbi:MAG: hypothetical protein Q9227_009365 [Pyrenula ochraceoflavens]